MFIILRFQSKKIAIRISDGDFSYKLTMYVYPNLLMCLQRLDFRLAALFLWMMLVLASLSSIFCTFGYRATASSLLVMARSLRTALRMVFA